MAIEKSAGAVVYRITDAGELSYLLLQPAPGKPWGFPKGKIDAGESEQQAARREIAEEAGLSQVDLDPEFRRLVHYTYHRGRLLVKKDVVYFLARVTTSEIRISWEHVAFCWASYDEAMTQVVYENAHETLRDAHAYLVQQLQSSIREA